MQDHYTMIHIEDDRAFLYPFGDRNFWKHVNFNGPLIESRPELGPCWLWTASVNAWGYGHFRLNNSRTLTSAHRFSYEQTYGQIVGNWLVCHHCDHPACVSPMHLWLGTNLDNSRDKYAKGRAVNPVTRRGDEHWTRTNPSRVPRGEGHYNTSLTAEKVRLIRQYYAAGGVTQDDLASEFAVSKQTIGKIIRRERWAHIE
jgi:hypothetical protein